jgi:hypothetical protein
MKAIATNYIKVLSHQSVEGETFVEVNCRDYDHYASLPDVVEVNGQLLARTGWNSDRDVAYYKSGCLIAIPR